MADGRISRAFGGTPHPHQRVKRSHRFVDHSGLTPRRRMLPRLINRRRRGVEVRLRPHHIPEVHHHAGPHRKAGILPFRGRSLFRPRSCGPAPRSSRGHHALRGDRLGRLRDRRRLARNRAAGRSCRPRCPSALVCGDRAEPITRPRDGTMGIQDRCGHRTQSSIVWRTPLGHRASSRKLSR
jgi:hypothetical protein